MRNKIILSVFITAISLTAYSCGVMRSLGLYNVPPPYSETYKEYFHTKCIDHPNSRENLSLYIKPVKEVFSPFEEIEIEVGIINHSKVDSMCCYTPYIVGNPWSGNNLDVRDWKNHKFDLVNVRSSACYVVEVDNYGRRLSPSIFSSGKIINPQDTLREILKFSTGVRYPSLLEPASEIFSRMYAKRENAPGKYTIHYEQNHEELDEIKGPIEAGKLISDTVEYYVRDYTSEELNLKKDVADILEGLIGRTHTRNTTDSLITLLSQRYPNNFYLETVKGYVHGCAFSDSVNAAKIKK